MTFRARRVATAALAALTLSSAFAATSAQAHDYGRPDAAYSYDRLGSADPCRRTAGNRALTWGVLGLLAGATAGGAAAGAGVVAEGAWLGGVVGGAIGAKAGYASAQCGTARDPYAYWNHPSYRAYNGEAPSIYYADPRAAEEGPPPAEYGYRDDYRYDSGYDDRRYDDRYAPPPPPPCGCEPYGYDGRRGYGASSSSSSSSSYDRYDYDRSVSEQSYGGIYERELPPTRYYERR
jgi:hypothetical protein